MERNIMIDLARIFVAEVLATVLFSLHYPSDNLPYRTGNDRYGRIR